MDPHSSQRHCPVCSNDREWDESEKRYYCLDPFCEEQMNPVEQRILEANQGEHGPEQQRIASVGLEWLDLMLRKNHDYGSSVFKPPLLLPNLDAGDGILTRMGDKMDRLQNLAKREALVGETFEDTIRDLGAYCLLYLARPK